MRMRRLATICGVCLLAVGCGSSERSASPKPPQKLPRAIAQRLAQESDAIGAALAAGDECGAQQLGAALRADTNAVIAQIPLRFREPLSSGVNALVTQLPPCVHVTVTVEPSENDQGEGRGKGHEKKPRKGRGKGHD
jgi:hypothetical protein